MAPQQAKSATEPFDDRLSSYLRETIRLHGRPKHLRYTGLVPLLIALVLVFPWPETGVSSTGTNPLVSDASKMVPTFVSAEFQRTIAER